jgi:lysophospholipase L1-like esterase
LEGAARWSVARIPPPVVDSGVAHPPCFNNPGVTTSPRAFGYHLSYRINKEGLRGPETTVDKPRGVKRLLLVGDSVIYGAMVEENDTLSAQLQRLLPKNWEVLNGGVGGYDSWDYEGWLRLKGLAFSPDAVVVGLYRNDHIGRDEYAQTTAQKSAPNRRLMAGVRDFLFHSEAVNAALYFLQRHQPAKRPPLSVEKPLKPADVAAIDGFFPGDAQTAQAVKNYLRDYRYDPYLVKDTLPWLLDVKKWPVIESPLAGIKKMCDERKIPLLVLVFPVQFEAYPGYRWPEPSRTIGATLRKLGIKGIDLQPIFAAHGGDELYHARYDYAHPDADAYALAANAVNKWLIH